MKKILLIVIGLLLLVPETTLALTKDCNAIDDFDEQGACVNERTSDDFLQNTSHAPLFCSVDSVKNSSRTISAFCSSPNCDTFDLIAKDPALTEVAKSGSLRDGVGAEFEKYAKYCVDKKAIINKMTTSQAEKLKKILSTAGACVGLNPNDSTTCPKDLDVGKKKLIDLQRRILAGEVVVINEEPIGTENVFTRMRVCTPSFVRDLGGNLQSFGPANDDGSPRYSVDITNCHNFIVDTCKPSFTTVNTKISLNEISSLEPVVYCDQVQIFTGEGGVGLLKTYVRFIYTWAAGFVGIISVFVILLSGIQLSASSGDSEVLTSAKTRIIQSLSALAILFLSGLILYVINPTFFVSSDLQDPTAIQDNSGTNPNNN